MAWCDVVEPCTLRECRIALGQSQAAFAATLGASPESYRTWDAGRRAPPPKVLARARALATHRDDDDHALLPLPVLALLIGVHVKTLRAAARDGRLPVTYDTRTTFRRLRAARHWRLLASFAIPTLDDRCGEQTGESRRVGRACQPTTMYRFARCVVRAG